MNKIYLASPFFNEEELCVYEEVISILRNLDDTIVFVPKEITIPNAWGMSNHIWAMQVFEEDIVALEQSNIVVVLNFGMYSDSGTAWEAGYAYAKGKHVIQVLCAPNISDNYSLMMLSGTHTVLTLDDLRNGELPCRENVLEKIEQK